MWIGCASMDWWFKFDRDVCISIVHSFIATPGIDALTCCFGLVGG